MRINVAQQLKGFLGSSRSYTIDEITEEGYPIKAQVKLVRTNRSILVTGQLKTIVNSTCSRCLKEFEQPMELKIEEEYFPARDMLTGMPTPMIEDMDGFVIGEDHILDLSEAVRQNILLNLSTKPVCRPECAGLCNRCGHNLNQGACHCPEESFDPRWSPLREMLEIRKRGFENYATSTKKKNIKESSGNKEQSPKLCPS